MQVKDKELKEAQIMIQELTPIKEQKEAEL